MGETAGRVGMILVAVTECFQASKTRQLQLSAAFKQELLFVFGLIFREVTGDISVEKKMILCSLLVLKAIHAKQQLPLYYYNHTDLVVSVSEQFSDFFLKSKATLKA